MEEFLAEDFEITRASRMSKERRPSVIDQALRVAANVYRVGLIEKTIGKWDNVSGEWTDGLADALRKALTDG